MLRNTILTLALLAIPAEAFAQDKVNFEREVLPVLRERCFECHSASKAKPKAGLRLDGVAWIRAGAKAGSVLEAGDASVSSLYTRAALPADDFDIMPPEGEALTKEQLATLKRWIDEGANFGTWVGETGPAEVVTTPRVVREPERIRVWRELGAKLEPLPEAAIDKRLKGKARLEPVIAGSPLLRLSFPSHESEVDDALLEALAPLRKHLAHVSLARTKLTDTSLDHFMGATALTHLDLRSTRVTDEGMRALASLSELRSLNLYGTQVTDESLAVLGKLPKLRDLYLWKSRVTREAVAEFRRKHPELRVRWEPGIPSKLR